MNSRITACHFFEKVVLDGSGLHAAGSLLVVVSVIELASDCLCNPRRKALG
jgi:hypothetical protein